MGVAGAADRLQRRHRWLGFPLSVAYKYVDDQGGFLAALITYYVVRACRLWPRSLLAPFTDGRPLTPADRRAYVSYVEMRRHKRFEKIEVSFDEPPRHSGP